MSSDHPKVSIGLPVFNGENFIREAVDSILSQTFEDFELIISDNASSDGTEAICRDYEARDKRIKYHRNSENLGAAANYTRVFSLASGEYFKWAAHDDVCGEDYLTKCVQVLDQDNSVVLCHSKTRLIDKYGEEIKVFGPVASLDSDRPHLRFRAALGVGEKIFLVWGLVRRNILGKTPLLGDFIGHDRPLFTRLSLFGRFYQVPEVLFSMREHDQRSVYVHSWKKPRQAIQWHSPEMAGKLIFPTWKLFNEHISAINKGPINLRERFLCYREMWDWCRTYRTDLWNDLILAGDHLLSPNRNLLRKLDRTYSRFDSLVSAGETFIYVDQDTMETEIFGDRAIIPFMEKNGLYDGVPSDDEMAIKELERLRGSGANFIVFARPAFWWLDYYSGFHTYIKTRFNCALKSNRLIVFDLRESFTATVS